MVDVDRRLNAHAHVAGLKRLSARASKGPVPPTNPRKGCFSFAPLARTVIERLRKCQIQIARGLSDEEFCRIEAPFAFSFPPDLKAILQEGLPVGAGFPDWRSGGLKQLRLTLNLPIAGLSYEVARGRFWCKQWGPRPADTEQAVKVARVALRKAPILIPVYRHCYIPTSPNLAGNPIFFVCQEDVFYRGYDLAEFFEKESFVPQDYDLPCDFASLDVVHGRAASLGGGEDWVCEKGCSFRLQMPLGSVTHESYISDGNKISASRMKQGERAESAEQRIFEEQSMDLEAWGRNLDALARKHDPSSANGEVFRKSVEVPNHHVVLKRRTHLPGSITNYNTILHAERDHLSVHHSPDDQSPTAKTPPSIKIARRIEFWSDIAEKRQTVNEHSSADHLFSCVKVDVDLDEASLTEDRNRRFVPYWLERYLDEMAAILRNGGWKEADVLEMVSVAAPPLAEPKSFLDRQSIMEALVLYVNLLSDALRRAGWSTTDVGEALDVELSFRETKRRPPTVPPRVAARIGKLAEYVSQF